MNDSAAMGKDGRNHWVERQALVDGAPLGVRCLEAVSAWARRKGVMALPPLQAGDTLLLRAAGVIHMAGVAQPLDIVFISPRGRVVAVYDAVRPGLRLRAAWGGWHCLEMHAGAAEALGIAPGKQISFV